MTNSRTRFLLVSFVIVAVLGTASLLGAQVRRSSAEPDSLFKYLSVFTEALSLVRQAYVENVEIRDLLTGAYSGATEALDPFSVYVPAEKVARFSRLADSDKPDSGLVLLRERGWLFVAGVVDGSPAQEAGIRRGDLVAKVSGEPTTALDAWEVQERIAAGGDTPVVLEIIRRQDRKEIALKASAWDERQVSLDRIEGIPVLRVSRFTEGAAAAAAEALTGVEEGRLLVDLRSIAGGDPVEAYRIAELMVSGELGVLKRKGEVQQRFTSSREPVWQGSIGVLVDRGTLGAAEVLAEVLAGAAEAKVVGEPTFGYAGLQEVVRLSSGGLLRVTGAFYAGPDGQAIDRSVTPSVVVNERSRTLGERDLSLDELILRRGMDALREAAPQPMEEAA